MRIASGDESCRVVDRRVTKKRIAGAQPLPNAQFCNDLRRALGEALDRRGFRTVANEADRADIIAVLRGTQTVNHNGDLRMKSTVRVDVSLRATAAGEEVETLALSAEHADDAALTAYLTEATQSLADGMAGSSGVRAVRPGLELAASP